MRIRVLNPLGKPPSVNVSPLTQRGKIGNRAIYFVDVRFPETRTFIEEMVGWVRRNRPEVKTELREKRGAMFEDDPQLWEEIRQKGYGAVVGLGH